MTEPRTHYQVTFSARQAVLFFAVFLGAIAGAYFLGIATGVSGRPRPEPPVAAAAAEATPGPTAAESPAARETPRQAEVTPPAATPAAPEARTPPALAAREPSSSGGIQFFEDRPEEAAAAATPPAGTKASTPAPASGGFWLQVLSTTSESEARARRSRLASKGYRAAVSPVRGAKGPILYRVRIGPYDSREEASKASEAIRGREKVRPWIVSPGG